MDENKHMLWKSIGSTTERKIQVMYRTSPWGLKKLLILIWLGLVNRNTSKKILSWLKFACYEFRLVPKTQSMLLLSTWGKYHLYFIVSHSVIIEIQLRGDCLTKPACLRPLIFRASDVCLRFPFHCLTDASVLFYGTLIFGGLISMWCFLRS